MQQTVMVMNASRLEDAIFDLPALNGTFKLQYGTQGHCGSRIWEPKFVDFVGIFEQYTLGDSDRLRLRDLVTTICVN